MLLETTELVRQGWACRRVYWRGYRANSQICTSGPQIGYGQNASSCFGDSGGPLVADLPGGRYLVGVVSFGGNRCGDPRAPSVYARVSSEIDWILAAAS